MKTSSMKKIVTVMIILLLCACVLFGYFKQDNNSLEAQAVSNEEVDAVSDEQLENYFRYIGTAAAVDRVDGNYELVRATSDDIITEFVSKNLFYTLGSNSEIKDNYGYFIITKSYNNVGYLSTVLVFQIETLSNFELTIDRVIVTIKPLFEYRYLCVKGVGVINIGSESVEYNTSDYCVFPFPTFVSGSIYYNQVTDYYLKDVSFAASLYNQQHLNVGDDGYNADEDYGAFFTALDYEYNGIYRQYGDFPVEDSFSLGLDLFNVIVGVMPNIKTFAAIGEVLTQIGKILVIPTTIEDGISFVQGLKSFVEGDIVNVDKKVTTQCYYTKREDQLAHYKDDEGRPTLTKIAAVTCNTDQEQSVWYGVGNFARAYFTVNHGKNSYADANYTRFVDNIALKIVDVSNDEVVETVSGVVFTPLYNPEVKTSKLGFVGDVYMLPEGEDYFEFETQFASDYSISINLSSDADVYVNGVKYTGKNFEISQYLEENSVCSIVFSGNELGLSGNVFISPKNFAETFSIGANETFLVEALLYGVKELSVSNSNVAIADIFIAQNGNLISYDDFGEINENDTLSYPFEIGTYYILLKNTSTQTVSTSLTIDDVPSLNLGNNDDVTLQSNNLNYFRVRVETNANYILTVANTVGQNFDFKAITSDFNTLNTIVYNNMFKVQLTDNEDYYIGIKTGVCESQAKIIFADSKTAYDWKISGGEFGQNGQFVSDVGQASHFEIERGNTYTIEFYVNGIRLDTTFSIDNPDTHWGLYDINFDQNNGVLTIPDNCPIGGNGIVIRALQSFEYDTEYAYSLTLVPVGDVEILAASITNDDDIRLDVTVPRFVFRVDYEINILNSTRKNLYFTFTDVDQDKNRTSISILSFIESLNNLGPATATIKIICLHYYNALGNVEYADCLYIVTTPNMFGSVSEPYEISCERHLNNIRYATDADYVLNEDIVCSSTWVPIPTFSGTIDGRAHDIEISNNNISANTYYGLIIYNYGTLVSIHIIPNFKTVAGVGSGTVSIGSVCAVNHGRVERCYIENGKATTDIYIRYWNVYFGGVVGTNYGMIDRCVNKATIRGNCVNFGGIVGGNVEGATIYSCSNYGNIYAETLDTISASVGGIVGLASEGSIISMPYNSGNILFDANNSDYGVTVYIGQIAGRMCSADKISDALCDGSAQIKPGIFVKSYMADEMVGYYFEPVDTGESSCISAGTFITLADGSQVPVESLTGNEMLLVWNMYTGRFDVAPILCIDSDPLSLYEVIRLSFSDGTTVDVISEHGFFDVDLNKYVYLDEHAADYIGHCFLKQGTDGMVQVTLEDVSIVRESTAAYSPVTYGHLCYFVNGMLSMPGGIDGLFNIFEVDGETMMYDAEAMAADIEKYGLYTYEELNALVPVPEVMFDAVNGQYLKVAVGKGIITIEQIGELVERYADLFE